MGDYNKIIYGLRERFNLVPYDGTCNSSLRGRFKNIVLVNWESRIMLEEKECAFRFQKLNQDLIPISYFDITKVMCITMPEICLGKFTDFMQRVIEKENNDPPKPQTGDYCKYHQEILVPSPLTGKLICDTCGIKCVHSQGKLSNHLVKSWKK